MARNRGSARTPDGAAGHLPVARPHGYCLRQPRVPASGAVALQNRRSACATPGSAEDPNDTPTPGTPQGKVPVGHRPGCPLVAGPMTVDNEVNSAAGAERAAAGPNGLDDFADLFLGPAGRPGTWAQASTYSLR